MQQKHEKGHLNSNLQLNAADDGPKEPHHAQELHSTQVLHRVLLARVGHGVQDGAEQDQHVAQQHVTGCKGKKVKYELITEILCKFKSGSDKHLKHVQLHRSESEQNLSEPDKAFNLKRGFHNKFLEDFKFMGNVHTRED